MWPGARIGIMGGSFNPPHDGHLVVARTALRAVGLDRLWWLVTPGNPLKSHDELPPMSERIEESEALARHPAMEVTDLEAQIATPYTAETVAFVVHRYPRAHFVWVMGADNLAGFERWQRWRDIADMVAIAVVDRPGWRFPALASRAARVLADRRVPEAHARDLPMLPAPAWTLLSTRLSDESSTRLRAKDLLAFTTTSSV